MGEDYHHSGNAPIPGVLLAGAMAIVAGMILGPLYAFAALKTPSAVLNPLLTGAVAVALAFVCFLGARLGKIRSTSAISGIATVSGAITLWIAWAVDHSARLNDKGIRTDFTLSPGVVSDYSNYLMEVGSWSAFGWRPTGLILGFSWLVEMAILVAGTAFLASILLNRLVYCEGCGRWAKLEKGIKRLKVTGLDNIIRGIRERDISTLRRTTLAGPKEDCIRLDMTRCGNCEKGNFLSLVVVERKKGLLGGEKLDMTYVIHNQPINHAQVNHVIQAGSGRETGSRIWRDM